MATELTYTEKRESINERITRYTPTLVEANFYALKLLPENQGEKLKDEQVDKIDYFLNKCEIYDYINKINNQEPGSVELIDKVQSLLEAQKVLINKLGEGEYTTQTLSSKNPNFQQLFDNTNQVNYDAEFELLAAENNLSQEDAPISDIDYGMDDDQEEQYFGDFDADEVVDFQQEELSTPVSSPDIVAPEEDEQETPLEANDTTSEVEPEEPIEVDETINEDILVEETETTLDEEPIEDEMLFEGEEITPNTNVNEDGQVEVEILDDMPEDAFDKTSEEDIVITLEEQEEFNKHRKYEEETVEELEALIAKDKITLKRVGDKYMAEYEERKANNETSLEMEQEKMKNLSLFFYKVECDINDAKQNIQSKEDKKNYRPVTIKGL